MYKFALAPASRSCLREGVDAGDPSLNSFCFRELWRVPQRIAPSPIGHADPLVTLNLLFNVDDDATVVVHRNDLALISNRQNDVKLRSLSVVGNR